MTGLDAACFWLINSHHTALLDILLGLLTHLGSGWVAGPLTIAIVVWKTPRRRLVLILAAGIVAVSLSGLINSGIKQTVRSPRPLRYYASHPDQIPAHIDGVHVIGKPLRHRSFPSGHTNTAFAVATVLIIVLDRVAWVSLLVAALVGYSRVYVGAHFPVDVVGGAVLAVLVTAGVMMPVMRWVERRERGRDAAVSSPGSG